MKMQKKTIIKIFAMLTVLCLFADSVPSLTANADSLSEETEITVPQETDITEEKDVPQEADVLEESDTLQEADVTEETGVPQETGVLEESDASQENVCVSKGEMPQETQALTEEPITEEASRTSSSSKEAYFPETLEFHANVEYSNQGYCVVGTFTEFPPDIVQIQPLSSQNNKSYQECDITWDLQMIEADHIAETKRHTCLHSNFEPLKSYLDGSLDRFYFKLRLTDKNGILYETQSVLIDRGDPQPLPEEITASAWFASNIRVREMRPLRYYGRYQITVKETATPKEISAVLPDTLPVEVQFMKQGNAYAEGTIDCPVTWKPLSLPSLTAGESVTIEDAAQEIIVPAGTLVSTPVGVFRLDAPLGIEDHYITDEVRLVLNVVSTDEKPTGALTAEWGGLELAFYLKPTGAASIQTYVISENEKKWKELPKRYGLALLDAVNAQPSTANSGYALVLDNEQEPYRSYLAAQAQGTQPTPFFVGLKIKGGVYDGQELILAYPNTYEKPLNLPKLGGSGGNESNAGAANRDDSTPEGQRPNLPQNQDTKKEDQSAAPSPSQTTKSMAEEKITEENMTKENSRAEHTAELSAQPDFPRQQTSKNGHVPDKVQAAAIIPEEASVETTAATDMQTELHTENAAPPLPSQAQKTDQAASQTELPKNRRLFPWGIIAAVIAVTGFYMVLSLYKAKNKTDKKS